MSGWAAMVCGLAGLAAAGAALVSAQTAGAAPLERAVVSSEDCSPGNYAGQAVPVKHRLAIGGASVAEPAPLTKGALVETNGRGAGKICLKRGAWACRVRPNTKLHVLPRKQKNVLLFLHRGRLSCRSTSGERRYLRSPHGTVTLADSAAAAAARRTTASRTTDAPSAALRTAGIVPRGGILLSLAVRKKRTVVKVRRGSVVVARRGNLRAAVVLGIGASRKGQQSLVRARRAPNPPARITLSADEGRIFRKLAQGLETETDRTAPNVRLIGAPDDPSRDTTVAFTFRASERWSIFSCALDGDELRLCNQTVLFENVRPGRHTLHVRATDPAGNAGRTLSYSWTLRRPPSAPIAFQSNRLGNWEIYVIDPDGTNEKRLTQNAAVDVDVAWSPDGTKLAFESTRDVGAASEIYVMNADGSDAPRRLTMNPGNDRNPKWSPFGNRIAFESNRTGNYEIYVMDADGSNQTPRTANPARDSDPAWSPDGQRIAFESDRDGNDEIYVMEADGSAVKRLTMSLAHEGNAAWSPDGKRIAFQSDRDGNHEIYVMNADGTGQTRLTADAVRDSDPVWSPDGSRIAFASHRDGNLDIYVMNADGSDHMRLTDSAGDDLVPNW
jgi:hypothetical protein